jgi:quinol monooxygenase YgiN
MHARLVIFKLGPGQRSTIQALAREFDPLYRAQPGFNELYVIADDLNGQYGSFSVWESQEDADAAHAVIAPQLQRALASRLQDPPKAGHSLSRRGGSVSQTRSSANLAVSEVRCTSFGVPRVRILPLRQPSERNGTVSASLGSPAEASTSPVGGCGSATPISMRGSSRRGSAPRHPRLPARRA